MAEEAILDPLSAMLMEQEAAKATQHAVKKVANLSNFLEEQEKDLGVRSSNLTPGKGAAPVSSGATLVSPAPVALPPMDYDGEAKQAVLEDPFEESSPPPAAPSATLPPVISGKSRQDTSDSVGSTSDLLETLTAATSSGPTSTSSGTTSTTSTTSTPPTETVSMRVSNLDATTIQEIQNQTHCTITTTAANPNEQTLTIAGTPSTVKAAKQLIRRHVDSSGKAAQQVEQVDIPLLPGEPCLYIDTKKCAYLGPNGKAKPIAGRLRMTDYRLIFEPEEQTPSHVRLLMSSGLFVIPLFAMSKFKTSIKNNNTEHFYLHIVCKDVRTFVFKIATDAQTTVRMGATVWVPGVVCWTTAATTAATTFSMTVSTTA